MSKTQVTVESEYHLCGDCLQYFKTTDESCPFCAVEKGDRQEEYKARNLKILGLMWNVEKKVEAVNAANYMAEIKKSEWALEQQFWC